ncbi:MAG: hypothetical protein R3277_06300 [Brumimicrobium sp.]|nr:hypothetical protein [Brumimicrobium sp.]
MKYILIFCSLTILFLSCKKDEIIFTVRGKISDNTHSTALAGAEVKLYSFELGSSLGTYESSVYTNSLGEYTINFERAKYEKIELVISRENYFSKTEEIPFSNLSTEEDNILNYGLNAKSWTKFIFVNQQPSVQDELKLLKSSGKTDCADCCPDGYSFYYGAVDTSFICANDGNTYMKFYYWVNGNEQSGVDSVFNTPYDTVTYELYY